MKNLILIVLLSLGLIGCQSNPIHTVETKTIYLGIPARFKEHCKMEKPITKEIYLSYTSKEKESYLYKSSYQIQELRVTQVSLNDVTPWVSSRRLNKITDRYFPSP